MKTLKTVLIPLVLVSIALLATACRGAKPAALSDDQVSQQVQNILTAISENDYQSFTQDFSDTMKSVFTQDEFTKLRDLLQTTSGNYQSCSSKPTLLNQNNNAIYRFTCKFDQEDVLVTGVYAIDGNKVEGLYFDSVNLRKETTK